MSTTRPMRQLARKRLDERFSAWKSLPPAARIAPRGGWVRAIREALGMPRQELGRRMGVGEKRVMQLENGEAQGKITVESLARAAEALDCELVVALLPRRPLEQTVTDRRMQLAASWLKEVFGPNINFYLLGMVALILLAGVLVREKRDYFARLRRG